MTFSEALEKYLTARENLDLARTSKQTELPRAQMKEAAEHLDTLTSNRAQGVTEKDHDD